MWRLAPIGVLLALVGAHGAEAQPVLSWAPADTLFADFEDRFTYVPPGEGSADAPARRAAAVFEVEYVGFPTEAREAFQFAVDLWSFRLRSAVPIRVRATWAPADGDVLGSTTPRIIANFERAPERDVWFVVALANARAGYDLDPDEPHVRTTFNSALDRWYFGTDGQTPSGRFDLATIALHELGHGLGFVGSMTVEDGVGRWGVGERGYPVIFDRFAERGDGADLLDESLFPKPSAALAAALQSEDVFFSGPAAVRAEGRRPGLHAPPEWVSGSSYSHLSEQREGGVEPYPPGSVNALMTPTIGSAEAIHDPGPVVCGMFEDMGWTLAGACATQGPGGPGPQDAPLVVSNPYPNPLVGPSSPTVIEVAVRETQHVEVYLFDTLGRRVATLFAGTVWEGRKQPVEIEGRGLAAGVYFVWVAGVDGPVTKPLTILGR